MRILFTVFAAKTHYFNLVPLASAFRSAGHQVIVAVQPDLVDTVTASGHIALPIGPRLNLEEETQQATEGLQDDRNLGGLAMSNPSDGPYPWDHALAMWTAMTAFVFQNVCPEPMIDELIDAARRWKPDLVIWDPLTLAGPIAAAAVGAANARLLFGPDQMGNNRTRFLRARTTQHPLRHEDPIEEWASWTFRRNRIDADPCANNLVFGDWTIDPTPPPFRSYEHSLHLPMQHVPYNGRSVMPQWALARRQNRRVVVTLGASLGEVPDKGRHLGHVLVDAVADINAEVLLTLPDSVTQHLGALPAHVRAEEFVPLAPVLESCDAIVHHGGSGTFLSALREGVPQVLIPDGMWDSRDKARGLIASNAGAVVSPTDASVASIRDGINAALDGAFTDGTRLLQQQILAMPTPIELVRPLTDLTYAVANRKGSS